LASIASIVFQPSVHLVRVQLAESKMMTVSFRQRQYYLSVLLTCLLWHGENCHAFSSSPLSIPSYYRQPKRAVSPSSHIGSELAMVTKKTKNNINVVTKSKTGGGFGSPASTTNAPQVRSVSGHNGSGTKPLRQAANTFDALRKKFGAECCRDVYVRAPLNDEKTFWFAGKIAMTGSDSTITPEMAIWSQKRLILEYAKHQLRPQNLGGKFAAGLDIWLAPGDSEMEVVQNKIRLTKVEGSASDLPPGFLVKETVGFNPEIYIGDEIQKGGLRVQRDPNTGEPIKPVFDVNQSV
jgi:hypothetical protein